MRIAIPQELRDPAKWPGICLDVVPAASRDVVQRRMAAVVDYVAGEKVSAILTTYRFERKFLWCLLRRCLAVHPDGRIWGFRACLRYARVKAYERRAPLCAQDDLRGVGYSGYFQRLMDRYPKIADELIERALRRHRRSVPESGVRFNKLHARFLELCREAGIRQNEYPFTVESLGARTLHTYLVREMSRRSLRAAVDAQFGTEAARRLGASGESPRIGSKRVPYERVEFDAHRMDVLAVVEIEDPKGGEPVWVPLERFWLLVAIDAVSRAILGYHISLSRHYSAEDVLLCLESAILPWKKRDLTIPGLAYAAGAGMPSGVIPDLAYAVWGELAFDNDRSNLSAQVWDRAKKDLGCVLNPGPVKTPESRDTIERFFGLLAQNGFQRLPSTTGGNAKDPRRRNPEDAALKYRIKLGEVIDLTDVLIANYNAEVRSGVHGRSPLEYLRFALERHSFFVRTIPTEQREHFSLTKQTRVVRVGGNIAKGTRPFVHLYGVRYYGPRLLEAKTLFKKKLVVEFDTKDLRQIRAFLPDGSEFDTLTAARAWAGTAHDLRMRRTILRHGRRMRIGINAMPDAVQAYLDFKSSEKRTKKENNKLVHALMKAAPVKDARAPLLRLPTKKPLRRPAKTNTRPLFSMAPAGHDHRRRSSSAPAVTLATAPDHCVVALVSTRAASRELRYLHSRQGGTPDDAYGSFAAW